ncbi:unnamed protein product [Pieris macdunnoughi]|uniref:Mediator of RNA polymerase II transcription subunit 13 n=1 Tax=Pieris macdunnoughi TaxID=345717 RepID=A0A821YBY6_9NEOP|nr:unnamed protein product [Pieris macdunnoughi]
MTHQNHQTNGASLEDCHTNFFALTELHGIKWRKLVWGETSGGGETEDGAAPLADPVISSYARCLAGDILCVWRRVPAPQPLDLDMSTPAPAPPPLSLRASKELWIFWYGEEPDLTGLVASELLESRAKWREDGDKWRCGWHTALSRTLIDTGHIAVPGPRLHASQYNLRKTPDGSTASQLPFFEFLMSHLEFIWNKHASV